MKIEKLKKQRAKAIREVEKSNTLIQKMKQELKERACEIGEQEYFVEELKVVSDKKLQSIQKRIIAEEQRNERLQLAQIPIERKLEKATVQITEEAVELADDLLKKVTTEFEQKVELYRKKQAEIKPLGEEINTLSKQKTTMQRDFSRLKKYLTNEGTADLIDNTKHSIERQTELRQLLSRYPAIATVLGENILQEIEKYDERVQKHEEEAKKERQKEIDERKSLMEQAMKWIKEGFYPYELHSSSHLLTPDVLFSYWKGKGLSPDDYDENRVLKRRVA